MRVIRIHYKQQGRPFTWECPVLFKTIKEANKFLDENRVALFKNVPFDVRWQAYAGVYGKDEPSMKKQYFIQISYQEKAGDWYTERVKVPDTIRFDTREEAQEYSDKYLVKVWASYIGQRKLSASIESEWVEIDGEIVKSKPTTTRNPVQNIYVVGSLRNPAIKDLAIQLRQVHDGFYSVFDDWFSAGPHADDEWLSHQKFKGNSMKQALAGPAAQHVCMFDKKHIDAADIVVLAMPAGKSGHLEAGYAKGAGKKVYVVFDKEPERWDVMYNLLDGVFETKEALIEQLKSDAEAYDAEPAASTSIYPSDSPGMREIRAKVSASYGSDQPKYIIGGFAVSYEEYMQHVHGDGWESRFKTNFLDEFKKEGYRSYPHGR